MIRCALLVSIGLLLTTTLAVAQADNDDELQPGLVATYRHGSASVQRVDAVPAIVVDPRRSGDPRLPNGPVSLSWRGTLLSKSDGKHRLHAFLQGHVSVSLAERTVLEAMTHEPQWVSGPEFELGFGEQQLTITAENFAGPFKLYWSSESFPLEPLPYHSLFHASDNTAIITERGRDLFEALRCAACHTEDHRNRLASGPSLAAFGVGTSTGWLKQRLTRTAPDEHSRMPAFGLSDADVDAIVAALQRSRRDAALPNSTKKVSEKERAAGEELVKSLGCLACHTWKGLGQAPLWGGRSLDEIAARRQPQWALQWLTEQTALNANHRMPTFALTEQERRQIVGALYGDAPPPTDIDQAVQADDAMVTRGRALMEQARCAACHELPPATGGPTVAVRLLGKIRAVGSRGCLSDAPDPSKWRPAYAAEHRAALTAYLSSAERFDHDLSAYEHGRRLLVQKNCLACHDRDGGRGLSGIVKAVVKSVPAWEGQAPTLVPPALTAVGDRMRDEPLAVAIKGEQKPRMTWLRVKMPKFVHTADESAALLTHLIGHDRIPDHSPATPAYPIHEDLTKADPQTLLAGRELTGGKGFSCVACHQLKDYAPPKVVLGTRGSDLYLLGKRIRSEYFFRWTRSPLRVLPGVEMPGYQRPHPTLLAGDMNGQLAAMWDALHDPQFTAPTNPAVVEQLWTLQPGDRPRIIRDVFTIPGEIGKVDTVPRAFAVGFGNGHSVLFDLDTASVRMWTLGDFARQRTQGKSWFWDMAGVPLLRTPAKDVAFALLPDLTRMAGIAPEPPRAPPKILLQSIEQDGDAVVLRYAVEWNVGNRTLRTVVQDRWSPLPDGLQRNVSQQGLGLPDGWVLGVLEAPQPLLHASATWRASEVGDRISSSLASDGNYFLVYAGATSRTFEYRTGLTYPRLPLAPALEWKLVTEPVSVAPGFVGQRLPLPRSIMPTALALTNDGHLAFTSLKGHVFLSKDSDGDGIGDAMTLFAEGLAAPYGVFPLEKSILIAHKPEVLELSDTDYDGRADSAKVIATGWGYTDDYHDWTCGIVQDKRGRFYIGLGSDYTHKNRPASQSQWRGHVLRFDRNGHVESVASGLRYPTGLAITDDDKLVCSDQQGVQNCFNELNVIVDGHCYGVPAQLDPKTDEPADPPAVQIPHPWTRSVNGLAAWPGWTNHPFAGQIVGAEYNNRFLIRCSLQTVDGVTQGAVYPLTKPGETNGPEELLGPMCVTFGKGGELYVGSIHDSGWLGGLNTGDIVKLTPAAVMPNGLREVRATPTGFALHFIHPVDAARAGKPSAYNISGYTRVWEGTYATPDGGRHTVDVKSATVTADARTVVLELLGLKPGFIYDIVISPINKGETSTLWPHQATYTLHRLP